MLTIIGLLSTMQVVRRARLYETAPAHVENQPRFLNTAVAARTSLPPDQLLAELKTVEVTSSIARDLRRAQVELSCSSQHALSYSTAHSAEEGIMSDTLCSRCGAGRDRPQLWRAALWSPAHRPGRHLLRGQPAEHR
jgi:7,8-dihydro-6-hydroxymethylpterin-pyrophosphokinase (HPPK)